MSDTDNSMKGLCERMVREFEEYATPERQAKWEEETRQMVKDHLDSIADFNERFNKAYNPETGKINMQILRGEE